MSDAAWSRYQQERGQATPVFGQVASTLSGALQALKAEMSEIERLDDSTEQRERQG